MKWSVLVGLLCGLMSFTLIGRPGYASDFVQFWAAARTVWHGGDPYLRPVGGLLNPGSTPALYPLPAYLVLLPLAFLPLALAGGVFMAVSSGLLAWGVLRTGMARLPLFLGAPFLLALSLGQWSPLLLAAALLPAIAPIFIAKPNIGAALWFARPRLRAAIIAFLLLVLSVAVLPGWPREWLQSLSSREEKFIPMLRPGGVLLLLAIIAVRRPEGRLLVAMSLLPQALFFYDQLLLCLIPRTMRQSMVMSLASLVLFLAWRWTLHPGDYEVKKAVPYAYALYFVALAVLLWNWLWDRRASVNQANFAERMHHSPDAPSSAAQEHGLNAMRTIG